MPAASWRCLTSGKTRPCGTCAAQKVRSMWSSIVMRRWIGSWSARAPFSVPWAARHLQDGPLVLYDITSSYFEGAYPHSELVTFGYDRDGKRGHEQMVIALLCSAQGCPVGVEVFAGNTQDASTVPDKIAQLQRQYGLKQIIFVGDRGMITHTVAQKIEGTEGLHTISALTHRQLVELLQRKVVSPELFDEQQIVEILDPQELKRRYCLCCNPQTAKREGATRERLLERARAELDKI